MYRISLGSSAKANVWFEALRAPCEEVRADLRSGYPIDVVLFYLARWCQKDAGVAEPRADSIPQQELRAAAERIAGHLAKHGRLVELFVLGDPAAYEEVRSLVRASARRRAPAAAEQHADEAMSRIAEVLLTGTEPSEAAARLSEGPRGPSNEYIFDSPFTNWARTIVINLIKDRWRQAARHAQVKRSGPPSHEQRLVVLARDSFPDLVNAIRELPPKQRAVMVLSLSRRDLHGAIRERLHELAPDLFGNVTSDQIASDADIAALLDSTPHRIAANRSEARRKLARQHEAWPLLLDLLLPHRSTRPVETRSDG